MYEYNDAPDILKRFLTYHETIKGHSRKTVLEYYLDLRTFFRFLKIERKLVPENAQFDDIPIRDVDIEFIKTVTLSEIYDFLAFLAHDRAVHSNSPDTDYGLATASRARKIATIRSFYKYLNVKEKLIDENPVKDLDSPKIIKTLPRFLSLDESVELLSSVEGPNKVRDYCILTLFLNCGLRISELIGLNLRSIGSDYLRVLGKGGKERVVYLNDACIYALNDYLEIRKNLSADSDALFLSSRKQRISKSTVHNLVKKHLDAAGLDSEKYSAHKLRHTAATLMLQNGVDVRTLQELLGHEHLNTTQIYTHVENSNLKSAALNNPLAGQRAEYENNSNDSEKET